MEYGIVPTISKQPSSKSHSTSLSFLRLPAEIRNRSRSSPFFPQQPLSDKPSPVYTLCLTNLTLHQLQRLTTRNHLSAYLLPPLNLTPSLLRTCRQIHAEALPILYGHNTFCAHPTFLTSIPFLLTNTRPVTCAANIRRIKRWYVQVRLDTDAGFSRAQISHAFSGAVELEVEVWHAMYAAADLTVLRLFEGVRAVRRARVGGGVERSYAAWLESVMMADYGSLVGERHEEKENEEEEEEDEEKGRVYDV
jgi:hypothetical protein